MKKYLIVILIIAIFGSCTPEKKEVSAISELTETSDSSRAEAEQESEKIAIPEKEKANPPYVAKEVENKSIEDVRSSFGFKLVKIIDVQVTDPAIKYMVDFVANDKIVVSGDSYVVMEPKDKSYYLYSLLENKVVNIFLFNNVKYVSFEYINNQEIQYFVSVSRTDVKYFSYDMITNNKEEIERGQYLKYIVSKKYENYASLWGTMSIHGKVDYLWEGYSLCTWRELRNGQGIPESYAGDEHTIGMYHGKELISVFPYLRIVNDGQFNQSPDGKYLALDAGFYRNDIYRDSPPSYYPKARYVDKYSGSKNDFYQYAVFIYEAVTEENIDILNDQTVEVLTFPNPEEAAAGITEVKRHTFDGSHLNVTPGEEIFWGTAIRVHDGTRFYREPNLDSEIVKEVLNEGRIQIIVDRAEEEETINHVTDYWYFLEDQYGERGWVFGDSHFDIVEEMPWFLKD